MRSKKQLQRERRQKRVRSRLTGNTARSRLSVFRSNKNLFAQLIDDVSGKTILGLHSSAFSSKKPMRKSDQSFEFGKLFGKRALKLKITKAIFDRGGYAYHGRVKAFADGVREAGIKI